MNKNTIPRSVLGVFSVVTIVLLAGGFWFYQIRSQAIHREAEQELTIIARMKVDQIAEWRAERLADAAVAMDRPFFKTSIEQLTEKRNTETINELREQFKIIAENHNYQDVFFADTNGVIVISLIGQSGRLHEHAIEALKEAFSKRRAVLTELHAGRGAMTVRLEHSGKVFGVMTVSIPAHFVANEEERRLNR